MSALFNKGQTVKYTPSGEDAETAVVEDVQGDDDGPFTYTVCVLKPRPGGGVTPQKPDITGVAESELSTMQAPGGPGNDA